MNAKILIVDENALNRKLLRTVFDAEEMAVLEFEAPKQALDFLRTCEEPAVVIVESRMTEMDGAAFCTALRNEEHSGRYTIVLSAWDARADMIDALRAGANDFIAKPVDVDLLLARVRTGMHIVQIEKSLADRTTEAKSAPALRATTSNGHGFTSRTKRLATVEAEESREMNVLLVEDEPGLAMTLEMAIKGCKGDYSVVTAGSLVSAAAKITENHFDVILLDLNLPDSQGVATFKAIHGLAPETPVIILSGIGDEELAMDIMRAGAQDYLVKGQISIHLLLRSMKYAIERHRIEKQLANYAEQLRVRNEAMANELALAHDIQAAFLPLGDNRFPRSAPPGSAALRVHSRYQPATELGGDVFDIFETPEGEVAIFIGDVMGHGVSAGLVSGILRGVIEEMRPYASDPEAFLTELNRGLRAVFCHADGPIFASAFYLVADVAKREIRFANAGHPRPYCLNRASGLVTPLRCGAAGHGPALGLYADSMYTAATRPLEPDDLFILYTDGLSDADDDDAVPYGKDRLPAVIRDRSSAAPSELFDFLLDDVHAFAGRKNLQDDICVLGVEMLAGTRVEEAA